MFENGIQKLRTERNFDQQSKGIRLGAIFPLLLFLMALSMAGKSEGTEGKIPQTQSRLQAPPHMDLEMTGFEYEKLMADRAQAMNLGVGGGKFDDILATGKRNLDWIRLLNQNRAEPISLSHPSTQQGFPLTAPRIYNPTIIRKNYEDLRNEMIPELREIIFGQGPLPNELPVDAAVFVTWGLRVDHIYQLAARWLNHEPYLDYLKQNEVNDIRGYYFIMNTPGLLEQLNDWNLVPEEMKDQVRNWLKIVCLNGVKSLRRCESLVSTAISQNKTRLLFDKYQHVGATIIESMMKIPAGVRYSPARWDGVRGVKVPFADPKTPQMRSYLVDNIQEEWKYQDFQLTVDISPEGRSGVQVIWEPGITPHVPGLGVGMIYMDANAPISEYDVRWTIRHEFGHVLGFPDCYQELFDSQLQAIVSYQLDTTNLMCSRRGHLQKTHVEEMQRVYF